MFEDLLKSQPIRALVVTPTVSNPLGSIMSDEGPRAAGQDHGAL
jgi:DNA-binding transcriptional MocR family regulator